RVAAQRSGSSSTTQNEGARLPLWKARAIESGSNRGNRGSGAARHLDHARLRLRDLRQRDGQDAVAVHRLHAIRVHFRRQSQRALVLAAERLDAAYLLAVFALHFGAALPADREHTVVEGDVEVLLLEPGQLRGDADLGVGLREVDARRVGQRGSRGQAAIPEMVEDAVEIGPTKRRERSRAAPRYQEVGGQHSVFSF